jgi:osmotically-inducible protein OsmY
MLRKEKPPDRTITQRVNEQLSNHGMRAPCHITVVTMRGNVTLSGTIQYEHQRRVAMHTTRAVEGVQRVVDQLRVIPKSQHWS